MRKAPFSMPTRQGEQSFYALLPFLMPKIRGKRQMKKDNRFPKTKMVRLLKWINGAWQVVDYGVPSKANAYAAMGYLVEQETRIKEM